MVHCTPSNKNQSASFRILFFFFWNFLFSNFFFFFLYFFPTSPRTIFIQWIKNRGNFSKFLRFVFACVSRIQIYSSLVFRIPWMRRDYQPNCIWNFMEIYFFEKSYGAKQRAIYFESNKCHFTTLFPIFLIEIDRPSSFFQLS